MKLLQMVSDDLFELVQFLSVGFDHLCDYISNEGLAINQNRVIGQHSLRVLVKKVAGDLKQTRGDYISVEPDHSLIVIAIKEQLVHVCK